MDEGDERVDARVTELNSSGVINAESYALEFIHSFTHSRNFTI